MDGDILPIVYGGYGVSDGVNSFLELETTMDSKIYDYLKDIKISAEPGNDDVVNFFTSFYPSIEHKYDRVKGLNATDIIDRYQIGNLLGDLRFERYIGKNRYAVRYNYRTSEESPTGYRNLWNDGLMQFVCAHVVEFTWYMSSIKTLQLLAHERYGSDTRRICVAGTIVKYDRVSDDVFNTFLVKESISDDLQKESVDIDEKIRVAISKNNAANAKKLDKVVSEYETKLRESYNFKFRETFKFVDDLIKTGWEMRDDGFHYNKRIDVYYMNVKGRVFDIPQGKYHIDSLFVPYGKNIDHVTAYGNHPHIFSSNNLCLGTLNRSIENIIHLPELLKTVVVDGGTYEKITRDRELNKIVQANK